MKTPQKKGFVITFVMTLIVLAAVIASAFLFSVRHSLKVVDQWHNYDECLLGLQSGMEMHKSSMDQTLKASVETNFSWTCLRALETSGYSTTYRWTNTYAIPSYVATVAVVVASATAVYNASAYTADILVTSTGTYTHAGVTRRVMEQVLYQWTPVSGAGGSVFDNAYFIDAHATFNGVNADFNGDIWINGDIDLRSTGSFHGNGNMKATGAIPLTYQYDTWATYGSGTDARRPMLYTDKNINNTNTYWPMGYSGAPQRYPNQTPPELPYIGPLSEYEAYAIASTGTLTFGSTTVTGVWGDVSTETSKLGLTNGADIGCLVITNGATINGVVVARGDVYIKGTISGQGTIYAGRNIYVIGDIRYANPPSWPKPDSNPTATATANKTKSFLGLCAKGSMLIGDFIMKKVDGSVDLMFGPTHASDASDLSLGYVSYTTNGMATFDGNYENRDGQYHNAVRTDGSARQFYEPILSDTYFANLNPISKISYIDGVLYANHMIAGYPLNATLNGAMVCSDEMFTRNGTLTFNWDSRLGSTSRDSIGFNSRLPDMLPRRPIINRSTRWSEL